MQEMHSKRPKFSKFSDLPPDPPYNLAPLAQAVYSSPIPKILPPIQIPTENPGDLDIKMTNFELSKEN